MKRSGFRAPLKMDFFRFFPKIKNSIETPVEDRGWYVGPPGWVKAMQAKGKPTDTPTSRYNGEKMKRNGFFH